MRKGGRHNTAGPGSSLGVSKIFSEKIKFLDVIKIYRQQCTALCVWTVHEKAGVHLVLASVKLVLQKVFVRTKVAGIMIGVPRAYSSSVGYKRILSQKQSLLPEACTHHR